MKTEPEFSIDIQNCSVHRLSLEDTTAIQEIYEKCEDYMLLVDGRPVDPKALEDDLKSAPPGKSFEDKFMFGITAYENGMIGVLDILRGYPDETTWWIDTLLFVPERRSQNLGKKVL